MRRPAFLFALVGLLALAVPGCGGSGDDAARRPGASTTTAAPVLDAQGSVVAPTTTSTTRAGDGRRATPTSEPSTTTEADSSDATVTPSPSTQPATVDDGSKGEPGAFARTLLRPQPATRIVVERQEQAGASPASSSFAYARDTLRRVTAKDVATPTTVSLPGGAQRWTADEIRALADANARVSQGGANGVVRLLFLRGTFEGNEDILGVAVRGDVLAVFSDEVAAAATPVVTGDAIETAVLVHELGHLLGLVDLARDTGRADRDHPGHSSNPKSVMYWAVESSLVGQVLGGPPPRDFDAADLADLDALRNGA